MIKNCIVVLNYNDSKTTIEFINAVKNYKILDLIVIVDNASTDNSYSKLLKYASNKIKVIKSEKNNGYNAGNNIGCKYIIDKCKKANIIITNPDIIVTEETINRLIVVSNNNEEIAICAPYVMQDNNIERGWKIPSPLVESLLSLPFVYRIAKKNKSRRNIRFYDKMHYSLNISYVDACTGCFFLIKSDIIKQINYFDEGVFLYGEEDILGTQIKVLNKKIAIVNDSVVIHNHSVSINKEINNIEKVKISNRSKLYFQKKYNNANCIEIVILYLSITIKLINAYIKKFFRR